MRRRVLLVEDNPHVRAMFAMMLSELGCDVEEAADGLEAIHRCASPAWDLLVTDLNLGSLIDGEEVARQLTARFPGLPVLYVSGDCSAFKGGTGPKQRFLQKPIAAGQFADAVCSLLEARDVPSQTMPFHAAKAAR